MLVLKPGIIHPRGKNIELTYLVSFVKLSVSYHKQSLFGKT
jgi:hypothetical protein